MQNVLVTGGAGYIGSHTCKELSKAGYNPVAYDNLSNGHEDLVKWGPLEKGDIRDAEKLSMVIGQYAPVAVIHLAACTDVGESLLEPAKYYSNNVHGSLVLLETMRLAKLKNIVFSSSCATYGVPATLPIRETAMQNPVNPYGRTKLIVEQMLMDYEAAYGMRWTALRYFNAAGADKDCETGERHFPETHLIPLALEAISGKTLKIFGDSYDTADGTCVRDFVHVSDLAHAHINAMNYLLDGGTPSALNLGTGTGHSVLEVIRTVEQVTGKSVRFQKSAARKGDPPLLVADPELAIRTLKWQPRNIRLSEIIETAWKWYQADAASRQEQA